MARALLTLQSQVEPPHRSAFMRSMTPTTRTRPPKTLMEVFEASDFLQIKRISSFGSKDERPYDALIEENDPTEAGNRPLPTALAGWRGKCPATGAFDFARR